MISALEMTQENRGVQDMLRLLQKKGKNISEQTASEETVSVAADSGLYQPGSSSNAMAQNFISSGHDESKYLKARKVAFESDSAMVNRQNAILSAGMAELAAIEDRSGSYAARGMIGKIIEQRMLKEKQQSTYEASEKNLEETKKAIEEKAQEAMAPTDENGNPIADPGTANGEENVQLQNTLQAESASAAETAPTTAAGIDPTPVAPVTPSVDIIV